MAHIKIPLFVGYTTIFNGYVVQISGKIYTNTIQNQVLGDIWYIYIANIIL